MLYIPRYTFFNRNVTSVYRVNSIRFSNWLQVLPPAGLSQTFTIVYQLYHVAIVTSVLKFYLSESLKSLWTFYCINYKLHLIKIFNINNAFITPTSKQTLKQG